MKLNNKTMSLICELEQIIGNECYNPNSLDGWTLEEGCAFRYPVTYEDENGKECKTRLTIKNLNKEKLNSVHYKFGSNNLFIGSGIHKVLEHLEEKYGINFDELMKNKK